MPDWFGSVLAMPIMAILRNYPPQRSVELAQISWDLGITCVEVPIQTSDAVASLRAVAAAARERGHPVGAGTVLTGEQVRAAVACGAAFTVAPGFTEAIAKTSQDAGLPHLPGVATPTELQQAVQATGSQWVKAFPAAAFGLDWFRSMRGPFPQVRLVATGGITADNAELYLAAGASAVAVGSALTQPDQLERLAAIVGEYP